MVKQGRQSYNFCHCRPSRPTAVALDCPLVRKTCSQISASKLYPWNPSLGSYLDDRKNSSVLIFDFLSKCLAPVVAVAAVVAAVTSKQHFAV